MRCCRSRGEIVDRNGVPLARDFRAYSLWFNPKAMTDGPPLIQRRRSGAGACTPSSPIWIVAQ